MPLALRPMPAICLLSLALAGCQGGGTVGNYLMFNAPAAPPVAATPSIEVPDCPPVDVTEAGAAKKRSGVQITVTNVARECAGRPDGSIVVKVGLEVRALAGPGGGAGRFDEPVYFVLKRGDRVLASRSRRVAVAIPAGDTQGTFRAVEGDLVVPPGIGGEFEIETGLGAPGADGGPSRNAVRLQRRLPSQ